MTDAPDSVLITGCSSGIGRATAERFHDAGWDVYATARTPSDIDDLAEQGMATLELDVTVDDDCDEAVETVVEESGGIGCLVNNAGYGETAAIEDLEVDALHAQFDVNTYGPHRLMREALPHMREQGDGTIVNMSSVGGQISQPGIGAYCASKFALEAMSDALRAEVRGFGVDVVLVEPGPVDTPFVEKAGEKLEDRVEEDHPYRELYERVGEFNEVIGDEESSDLLTGVMDRMAVPPERIAEVVVGAAESSDPKPRYKPSVPHKVMGMGRYLPDRVRDWAFTRSL